MRAESTTAPTAPPERLRAGRRLPAWSAAPASIAALLFTGTFLLRWLTLDFDNDYFMHVAWGAEMLRGAWPVRDFVEPGFILQTLVSYVALRLGGYQLILEGAVASALIAAGVACVYLACWRAGIPRWLAVFASLLAAASYPRLYAYPKAFVYAAALLAIAIYARRPARRPVLILSAVTAIAFLFRHDHAVWIGAAVTASLLAFHRHEWRRAVVTAASYAALSVLLVTPWLAWVMASGQAAAYFGFLAGQSGGLVTNRIVPDRRFAVDRSQPVIAIAPIAFPQVGIRWAVGAGPAERRTLEERYGLERLDEPDRYRLVNTGEDNVRALVGDPAVEDTSGIDRSTLRVPGGLFPWLYLRAQQYLPIVRLRILPGMINEANAQPWLTYVTYVVPWVTLAAALVIVLRSSHPGGAAEKRVDDEAVTWALILPAALLGIITYQMLVRGSPDSRLGDVASITALLSVWLSWRAWTMKGSLRLLVRPLVAAGLMLTLLASASYGGIVGRLADAGVDGPTNVVRRIRDVGLRYAARPLDVFAPPGSAGLPALARWLNDCTAPDERAAIIGFEPQVFVLAERGFAGGMVFYDLGWASSERDQALIVKRWAAQRVPVVLAMASEWPALARDYPRVRAWIDQRYELVRQSAFGGNKEVLVLMDASRPMTSVPERAGLPCHRGLG